MFAYRSHSHFAGPWWVSVLIAIAVLAAGFFMRKRRSQASRVEQSDDPSAFFSTPGAPGWYPDPVDTTLMRYYDGQTWTTHTAPRQSG